jgi:HEAT repeat protein
MRNTWLPALAVAAALAAPLHAQEQEDVASLIEKLAHPNAGQRGLAAMTLGERGAAAKPAVPALAAALADGNLNVRYWAAHALGEIGPAAKDAVPALIGALRTSFPGRGLEGPTRYYADARVVAVQALGRIGPAARLAVPALKKALEDEDESVRGAAGEALKQVEARQGGRP